jgi:hypothetical protein
LTANSAKAAKISSGECIVPSDTGAPFGFKFSGLTLGAVNRQLRRSLLVDNGELRSKP